MNEASLATLCAGAYASIQDAGRRGYRRFGVPLSGVLDANLQAIANALVGQAVGAPVIECFDGGQQWRADGGPVLVAVAGDATVEIADADGPRTVGSWRSYLLAPGDSLRIIRTNTGRQVMLAVAGLQLAAVLGSASTYARAGLGGLQGRALSAGDSLPVTTPGNARLRILPRPFAYQPGPIRVVPGPQHEHFSAQALRDFLAQDYKVGNSADRMGIRLEGQPIAHATGKGHEIVSDAIVPGAIQVPGNGLPIILLADAQTAGGYPKIATVISADLPRVAGCQPGQLVSFQAVQVEGGIALLRRQATRLAQAIASIRLVAGEDVDLEALYHHNLVGGVVDALHPEILPTPTAAVRGATGL